MTYIMVQEDVESRLPSDGRLDVEGGNIQVIPANFRGAVPTNGFVRLNVFSAAGEVDSYGFGNNTRGFVEFNVFVEAGAGERRAYRVADVLDGLYQGMTEGNTTFFKSTIAVKGIDTENPQLWRLDYRVPFTRYN